MKTLSRASRKRGFCGCETIFGIIVIVVIIYAIKGCFGEDESDKRTPTPPKNAPQQQRSLTQQELDEIRNKREQGFLERAAVLSARSISVSATLDDGVGDSLYSPRNLLDRNKKTAWAVKTSGTPWIELNFNGKTVKKFSIANGNQKKSALYKANSRAKTFRVSVYDGDGSLLFNNELNLKDSGYSESSIVEESFVFDSALHNVTRFVVSFDSFYEGERWSDELFISELTVYGE